MWAEGRDKYSGLLGREITYAKGCYMGEHDIFMETRKVQNGCNQVGRSGEYREEEHDIK